MNREPFKFQHLRTPCLMGIVNVTPNSFSDGGAFLEAQAAVERGKALVDAGAEILDLGAEASSFFRKGVNPVEAEEQLRRLQPVVAGLLEWRATIRRRFFLSVDTRSAVVAREMLRMGVEIINDISAGEHDPEMLHVVAEERGAIVLMHISPGYPATAKTDDPEILATVRNYLRGRVAAAVAAGIPLSSIAVDPGVGFGKTMADNWQLAVRAQELGGELGQALGVPVVLGASRKRFLETPGASAEMLALADRLTGEFSPAHPRDGISAALTGVAARTGVPIHRVHDVALAAQGIRLVGPANARMTQDT